MLGGQRRTVGRLFSPRLAIEVSRLKNHVGDLVHTRLLGKHIIIISSEKIAKDLLEYRAKNYSDRPSLVTNSL